MPSVTLISSLPAFQSLDAIESTPASFADLPVIIKHQENNVRVTIDPPVEGYQSDVQGSLYILTSVLVFMPHSGSSGFQIEYPTITLHAISRSESGPSVYCQLDDSPGDNTNGDGGDDESDTPIRELIIVPEQPDSIEKIFESLSQCASLHPDPEGESEEDAFLDESSFETFNGTEDQELSEVGRAALEHMESIIDDPHKLTRNETEGIFDDAPEGDSNGSALKKKVEASEA